MPERQSAVSAFVFADHLRLDESPTREFYKNILQGLIHKNNNVLGVIQGFSSLILMDSDIPTALRDNVLQMRDSSQEGSDLAKVILTAAGCAGVSNETISLTDFMPNVFNRASGACDSAGVTFQANVSPDLPVIAGDSSRFNELLSALISNAVEAASSRESGEVAIDLLKPGEASPAEQSQVDLFIRNSSETLSLEQIREAFGPFYTTKGANHFGLGLTLAGVVAGQLGMKLGMRSAEGTTTLWLGMPTVAPA